MANEETGNTDVSTPLRCARHDRLVKGELINDNDNDETAG